MEATLRAGTRVGAWAGRTLSGLAVLFLVFDGVTKVIRERHVLAAARDLGYTDSSITAIGALLLVCTALYAIPRTSVSGAVLLTAYLGGAVATNLRVSHPLFETLFPVIFAGLVWGGLFLREGRLADLLPLRR
jgi:hypothetical protein